MSDYKIPVITKEMALRNAIFGYIVFYQDIFKDHRTAYVDARKSINIILEEIISLLEKGDD